jgi:hypothetical protein
MSPHQLREGGLIALANEHFDKLPIRRRDLALSRAYAAKMLKDNAELSAAHGRGSHEGSLDLYKVSPRLRVARTFFLGSPKEMNRQDANCAREEREKQ